MGFSIGILRFSKKKVLNKNYMPIFIRVLVMYFGFRAHQLKGNVECVLCRLVAATCQSFNQLR